MTPRTRKPQAAAVYCRISKDRNGEQLAIQRQRKECSAWAEAHGWAVAEVYADDDISAYSGAYRPAYRRMLADLAEGRRDGLVVYHPDRLHRSPLELNQFIEVVERVGLPIGTVSAGDYDLTTASGRMTARIVGDVARHESERISERIRSKQVELAENGKVSGGGHRAFGYRQGGMEINSKEAALIEEATERVLAGEGLRTVTKDWNRRSVKTVTGAQWTAVVLKRVLTSARISGQREHNGRIVGPAAWPQIVSPATTARLRAVLEDPARGRARSDRYLLSGLLRCGACGQTLYSRPGWRDGQSVRRYHCIAERGGCGGVGILAHKTEELVVEAILERLDGPAYRKAAAQRSKPKNGTERALRALEAREAELAEMWAAGELNRAAWSAARDRLARDIEEARARVAGRVADDAATELVGQGASLRDRWPRLSAERQRTIISTVVADVEIAPVSKSANRFDGSRVHIRWRV